MNLGDFSKPNAAFASSYLKLMYIQDEVCVIDEHSFMVLASKPDRDSAIRYVTDLVTKWYDGRFCRLLVQDETGRHIDTITFNNIV